MTRAAVDQITLYERVAAIPDPEIPVVTIEDLGILRAVEQAPDGCVCVSITPTYSGCPAMNTIEQDIVATLSSAGFQSRVELILHPPWTTDSITAEGRDKLKAYGIAPPVGRVNARTANESSATLTNSLAVPLFVQTNVCCPRCSSMNTAQVSAFGATACKEQWQCNACLEPFEYFKCHR